MGYSNISIFEEGVKNGLDQFYRWKLFIRQNFILDQMANFVRGKRVNSSGKRRTGKKFTTKNRLGQEIDSSLMMQDHETIYPPMKMFLDKFRSR